LLKLTEFEDQDTHLDVLSESIRRQKEIGMQIGDELELHIDLLDQTEADVDNSQDRLGAAGRRLRSVHEISKSANSGNALIAILVVILLIVIIIAKWTK
jgi:syntaxin 8